MPLGCIKISDMLRLGVVMLCALATAGGGVQTRKAPAKAPVKAAPAKAAAAGPGCRRRKWPCLSRPGEVARLRHRLVDYVTAGTATVTVKEKKPSYDSTAYYIVAEGRPTLARVEALHALLQGRHAARRLLAAAAARLALREEGKRHRMKTTTFNQRLKKASTKCRRATLVEEGLGASPASPRTRCRRIYVLRSIPIKAGEKFNMPVTTTAISTRCRCRSAPSSR